MSGPISPTIPNGAQPSTPKGQVVQIVSLPDGLKDNARNLRIEGEVIAQNKDGSVRVRTERGDIDIQVRGRQPQVGAKMEVEIPAGHPPRTATIRPAPVPVPTVPLPQTPPATNIPLPQTPVTQPPPTAEQPAPVPTDANAPKPQAPITTQPVTAQPTAPPPQPTTLPPLSVGQTVQLVPLPEITTDIPIIPVTDIPETAVIDKAAAQATQAVQKVQTGLVGTLLHAVKSVLPPLTTSPVIAQIETAMAEGAKPATIATPALQTGISSNAPITVLTPQALVLSAKILSLTTPMNQRIFMPQTATPTTPLPQTPITGQPVVIAPMTSTIEAITPQNQPVVQISMNTNTGAVQNFVLLASADNTPPGTQITLLPQTNTSPTLATTPNTTLLTTPATSLPPAWRALLPLMQPASIWPAFDDVFQSFYQTTPQAAQILGRIIPSPANTQNFGPAMLLFAAAMRTGALENWMGEKKLEMMQKLGKDGLVSRLSGELSSLTQGNDAPATDWKSYPIPMLYQHEVAKVMLHTRQEPEDEGRESNEGATRFIMDVSLNRMGEVQLDATVRGKQVNLIVRTQNAISLSMQDAMRTAYATALDNTDIYGDIGFQADVNNFVQVLKREDALAQA